ncbi:MAG: serine/threonine-protein kinase [Candidatus Obscuribacterales bacterium]
MCQRRIEESITQDIGTAELTVVNGFHDLTKISSGASGIVYSAVRDSDNLPVAIKIFEKQLIPDSDAVRRFEHEVETLKKLSHPNIVKILGSGSTQNGESFIVMEKVEGETIQTILDRDGKLEPQRAVIVSREVCRALKAAHESGIIHRDLKPKNIILDSNNFAKIVDFGIAKAVGSSTDTITQYGAIIGTPAYMSPEQCLGKAVDARSDVYSLGCTLFEMLTGVKAFESNTAIAALAKQIHTDRSFLTAILIEHQVPKDLQEILLHCLAKEPNERFSSAAELDHALSAYLLQITNSDDDKKSDRNWMKVLTSIACLVAILVVFESIVWSARQSIEQTPSSPTPTTAEKIALPTSATPNKRPRNITITINNKLTGLPIYSETAPELTVGKALQHATEKGVSFYQANLADANLVQAELKGVDLRAADLSEAKMIQANLYDVKLDGGVLTRAKLIQCTMTRCSLKNIRMDHADLGQMHAPYTVLTGSDLSYSHLCQAELMNCNLRGVNFTGADTMQAEFFGSDISGADFALPKDGVKPDLKGCMINGVRII